MTGSRIIPQFSWWTQGYTFSQDSKVLSLGWYDLILGGDWLEDHSPMWVHWHQRLMRFTHEGRHLALQGIRDKKIPCKL